MDKLFYLGIIVFVAYYIISKTRQYNNLYKASKNILLKHYTEKLLEKITYLQSIRNEDYYSETFKSTSDNLKDELKFVPKDIRRWAWTDAVNKHNSLQPPPQSGWSMWGRASYYNEFKDAIGVID